MRFVISGLVAVGLAFFMAMWAFQDASLFMAGGEFPYDGQWQAWTSEFLFLSGIILFVVAWLKRRNRRSWKI
jgi:hypothetical protein